MPGGPGSSASKGVKGGRGGLVFGDGDRVLDKGVWKRAKTCQQCLQIVVERAKWKDCWDEVRFCSDRCKAEAKKMKRQLQQAEQAARNDGDGAMQPCQAPP
ncbi:hypothetical protein ACK3TF_001636 [Chlorella vulgaris]